MKKKIREALIKSARADSERFCSPGKYEKQRNPACISCFSYCTGEAKDPLLSRRRFIQSFLSADPNGSYTGRPEDPRDSPVQDADDL